MPGVHRVASSRALALGPTKGVSPEHLDTYLNEFTFRFNRRTRAAGLLFYRSSNRRSYRPDHLPQPRVTRVRPVAGPHLPRAPAESPVSAAHPVAPDATT